MPAGPVLADQIIRLSSPQGQTGYPELLRRVHYLDQETGKEYVFLTNRLDLPALGVAKLYRRCWQIGSCLGVCWKSGRWGNVLVNLKASIRARSPLVNLPIGVYHDAPIRQEKGKGLSTPSDVGVF